MIGQSIAQTCRLEGAASVSVSDPMASRRALARAGGFRTLEPGQVEEAGPFDVSFDAVGITATAYTAIQNIPKAAVACFVGLGLPEVSIPLFDVVVSERLIVGSFCYPDAVFEEALDHLAASRLDLDPLIGSVESFEDTARAFEDLATGVRADAKIMMSTGLGVPTHV